MDVGEATAYVLGGVGGKAIFDFLRDLIRSRGARAAAAEKREEKTDEQLWAWLARERAERLDAETKCDQRIKAVEAEAAAARREAEECERRRAEQDARIVAAEKRAEAAVREAKDVRQAIGLHREDDTPRLGLRKTRRDGDE